MQVLEGLAELSPEQQRAKLAALLRKKARATKQAPLSFAQERLWFLDQFQPGSPMYNMPMAVRLTGRLDVAALERSLVEIVRRHETLRTTFTVVDERPSQTIAPALAVTPLVVDLREFPKEEREAKARQLAGEEAKHPFDLARGPLVRAVLLRLEADAHLLLLTLHHIVTDGWSMGVLIQELAAFYQVFSAPRRGAFSVGRVLPDLPLQYSEFARWQRGWLQGDVLASQLAYWKRQLTGAPAVLELPTDRPRPLVPTAHGARRSTVFPRFLSEALKALSQRERATLFVTLLTGFSTLLYRYTGQVDVVIGTPIANRTRAEVERLIGVFVNTLALRSDLSGNPTFRELLGRVRETTTGAYAHQDLPFEMLVEALGLERDMSHSPLFQVMFVLQNAPLPPVELPGLTLSQLEVDSGTAKFDLSLIVIDTAAGLRVIFEYNADLFEAETVERMLGHFQVLLSDAVANPDRRLTDLALLTENERRRLLLDWNNTQVDYPQPAGLHELFDAQTEKTPDAIALVFPATDSGEDQYLTYAELNRRANQLAHHLRKLGVGPDVLVGICLERSLEMVLGLFGILKAGGAYVPLDPSYPPERLAFMLEDARVSVLLTHRACRESLPGKTARTISLDTDWEVIAQESAQTPSLEITSSNLAYMIYTSGSTGRPKGAMNAHRGIINRLLWMQATYQLTGTDRVLQKTPFSFDVSVWEFFWPLLAGASLVIARPEGHKDSAYLVQTIVEQGVTTLHFVPSMLRVFLEEQRVETCRSLQRVICSGEALPFDLVERFFVRLNAELHNLYGPTEAAVDVTFWECRPGDEQQVVPIGRPIANKQIYLLDARSRPVPLGVPGELHIGGAGVGRGYWRRPELTAERFIPNPFSTQPGERLYRTGDLASYLPDGSIEFLGRIDFQVKVRGFRIELGEIEAVLSQHPSVRETVLVAQTDKSGGQRLVAYVVPAVADYHLITDHRLLAVELRNYAKGRLPDYMVPSAFILLEALPLTPNGKVDRRALPKPEHDRPESAATFTAPRTPIEEVLADIWAKVLGLERVGAHDDFFELGGHSLLATQVIARVRQAFQVELPLRELFKEATVAALAESIERLRQAEQRLELPPVTPAPRDGNLALSFAQRRVWFLDQLEPGNPAYNIPVAVRLAGRLNLPALERSLHEVIQRHEALRTTFASAEGQPAPAIAEALDFRFERWDSSVGRMNGSNGSSPRHDVANRLVDLSGLPQTDREARAEQLATEEAQRPFDLATGPLMRATLLRLSDDEHVLLLTMHHIISDGWSMGVLVNEVAALYGAFARPVADNVETASWSSPLPEPLIQYADFADWQNRVLQAEVLEEELRYWKRQLAGPLPVLELGSPLTPSNQVARGARQTCTFAPPLVQALRGLSRQAGVTLYITLLTALKALLYRYTGQTDVVVGSPIALRDRTEVEGLIGLFLNTLVLRTDLSGDPTFLELLGRVRQVVLEAFDHKDFPFELLVDRLQPTRELNRNPLFQVVFVMQNAPMPPMELPGLKLSLLPLDTGVEVNVPDMLGLSMRETDAGLLTFLEYRSDLAGLNMLDHLQTLLESIVTRPQQRLSELPILTEHERRQLLADWTRTQADYPTDVCLHQLIEAQVERTPDAIALSFEDRQLTYRALNRQADQLAHALRAFGVGPDVLVGVCAERSLEMVVGLLGTLKAGGAYVPLDPTHPPERLALMLQDARPAVVLTQAALADRLPEGTRFIQLDAYGEGEMPHPPTPSPEMKLTISGEGETGIGQSPVDTNLAYMIYTSGSTGVPKGTMNAHRGIVNRLMWMQDAYHLTGDDRVLQKTPYTFDVSVWEFFWPLLTGACLVVARPEGHKDSAYLANLIGEQHITTLHFVPAMLRVFLEEPGIDVCRDVKRVICSGEALPADLQERFFEHFDAELHNLYGPTEAAVDVTYWACRREGQSLVVPIGRAIANIQIYLLDRHLNPVPVGVAGELHIGGVGLGRGYLNRPDLTADRFIPNPFPLLSVMGGAGGGRGGGRLYKTGDLARYLPDGNIEFIGRIDYQVKIRGFRIELGEIEAALSQHPEVQAAVVVAREVAHRPGEKQLVAYAVLRQPPAVTANDLRDWLRKQLPDYMLPSTFVFLDVLPLTSSGKVDRRALPAPESSGVERTEEYRAPETPLEETLVEIWSQALGVERMGIDDNVFNLGAHSLIATQVIHQINKTFEISLPLRSLFEEPTVAGLAVLVEQTLINEIMDPA